LVIVIGWGGRRLIGVEQCRTRLGSGEANGDRGSAIPEPIGPASGSVGNPRAVTLRIGQRSTDLQSTDWQCQPPLLGDSGRIGNTNLVPVVIAF
jgi:hypothetical protein